VRTVLSFFAIALTFVAYFPYIRSILRNESRPHVFSWVVWGLTTFVVFFAQLQDGGGRGAWPIGVSGLISIGVAFLAWRQHESNSITAADWIFFWIALGSILLWYFTSTPLWSVITLTVAEVLGFGPTLRKVYDRPYEEKLTFWYLLTARNLIAIAALDHLSWITILFPALSAAACLATALVGVRQRRVLGPRRA
jgi:hypothetical protein